MTTQLPIPVLIKPQHPFLVGLLVGPLFFLLELVDRAVEISVLRFMIQFVVFLPFGYVFLVSILGYTGGTHDRSETTGEALVAVVKNVALWLLGGLTSTAALAILIHADRMG